MARNVTEIQRRFIELGYLAAGEDDGTFGPVTLAAYNRFRASKGEPPHTGLLLLVEISADVFPEDAPRKPSPQPKGLNIVDATIVDYIINFLTSKINWFAGVMAGLIVGFINTKFGLQLDAATTAAITTLLVAAMTAGIWLLRTFFNKPKVVSGKTA